MEKKIIAVACALLMLVMAFTACGKVIVTGDNGIEYEAVTDEEGNTVVNEDGEILVYVTDGDGDYIEDANGEPQTNVIDFPSVIAGDGIVETPYYTLTVPEGWTAEDDGRLVRDDNGSTYIQITRLGEAGGVTPQAYVEARQGMIDGVVSQLQADYPDTAVTYASHAFTAQQLDSYVAELRAPQSDGTMFYYAMNIYFVYDGYLYKVDYICSNGSYDATFDALAVLDQNLVMK